MKHVTLFISDLHLDPTEPQITNTFFYFLDHIARDADALYILGDFFESYIGDDDNDPFILTITRGLHRLAQLGTPIFVMHGNRDFLMGLGFEKQSSTTLIPDPSMISLYGKKFLLLHGDSLCTNDKSHQRFRKITRYRFIQKIFLSLPLSFRKKFAGQLRSGSMQQNQKKSAQIMDVTETAVTQALHKNKVQQLIHGHTHRPMISDKRIVLDAWHNHGNYLQIDRDGNVELINIPH